MQSIPAVFREQVQKLKSRPMVFGKHEGHWRPLTWYQMGQRVDHAAAGLMALGVRPGDRVAIFSQSGVEWVLADLATLSCGGTVASVYETSTSADAAFMLRDSRSRLVFVRGADEVAVIRAVYKTLPDLEYVVCFDEHLDVSLPGLRCMTLLELERMGENQGADLAVAAQVAALGPDDVLTLIYTSGTTGEPKGVVLTHGNILSNCEACARAVQVRADDVLLSFLPLSHAFERMAGYYMAVLFGGATVYFAEGIGRLLPNLREVRPTLMTGVPRVYEKVYAGFMSFRTQVGPARRAVIDAALMVGRQVSKRQQDGHPLNRLLAAQYKLVTRQVFSHLRDRLGGRIRLLISGGAPLSREVAAFFHAAGLLILEGYGLTETAPVVTVNRPRAFRFGSVGQPLDNVRIRIADDGEILVRGPNVMRGYDNQPEATAAVLDESGWLHTGDIGRLDADGFLFITDRKKDLYKTSTGNYIAPQRIEQLLCSRSVIEQAAVFGDRRPYSVALLVPALDVIVPWAQEKGIATDDVPALLRHPAVQKRYRKAVDAVNVQLARHEAVRGFRVLEAPFTVENGLLTPSYKVRRKAVFDRFGGLVDRIYMEGRRLR